MAELAGGPITYDSLAGEVARRLRDAILEGRFSDGDRIVERDIAAELEVSRGPIRDALKQLEYEGLLVLEPRKGARVATVTPEDAYEVLEIRSAVEPVAVRLMIQRRRQDWLPPLDDCVKRIHKASDAGDWSSLVALDMDLHESFFRQSGSKRLIRIWEVLRAPLLQTFRIYRQLYDSSETVYRSHRALLDAIISEDPERAAAAVHDHILNGRPRLLERLSAPHGESHQVSR